MNRVIRLAHNQPAGKFYRGGAKIAAFRADAAEGDRVPEDWVGSTTTLFADDTAGLSVLPGGRTLRDAVTADPVYWLGTGHVARYGADTMLLVKLLDAGERLPVHSHPSREFASAHLHKQHGKAEAWCILNGGQVRLGFRRHVSPDELAGWVATQDTEAMLAAMHVIDVRPGDSVFVPAGLPHALGEGTFVVEVQEPEDMSILLEWKGFQVDGPREGNLGLGIETVLEAVDRRGWSAEEIATLVVRDGREAETLAPASRPFFRAERITVTEPMELDAGFSIFIALDGTGRLTAHGSETELAAGDTVLVPFAAGGLAVAGQLTLIRCRPPPLCRTLTGDLSTTMRRRSQIDPLRKRAVSGDGARDPHVHVDRAALEAVQLAQPPGDEPTVLRVQESGGEQHERRRPVRGLRAEQDARLLAAAHRMRVLRGELGQQRVELAGRDAGVPATPAPAPAPAPASPCAGRSWRRCSPAAPR